MFYPLNYKGRRGNYAGRKRSSILIKKYPQIQIFYNFLGSSLEKKNRVYDAEIVYKKSLEVDSITIKSYP